MKELNPAVSRLLQDGTIIPAHPLALNENLQIDEERQRRLTRYYIACGVGGLAVGVHTTQFEIRKPEVNLLEAVYKIAAEEIERASLKHPFIKIAGICGITNHALKEAHLAVKYGYDLGLISLGGLADWTEDELLQHVKIISEVIPVFGFYLQPTVGGRILSFDFWKEFAEIPNVKAIKVAAFNRYQTLDVVRAVCSSSRRDEIALYSGNDDNIVGDLLTAYKFKLDDQQFEKRFVGGLLGHWSVWTKSAVDIFGAVKYCLNNNYENIGDLLTTNARVTDMNAAIFDTKNAFHGCIPGIHEVLRRQGLLEGRWCLNPQEKLSKGQLEEIERIYTYYPQFTDDQFVKEFLVSDLV
jgi:Dihydrodipicolinate synthetase family